MACDKIPVSDAVHILPEGGRDMAGKKEGLSQEFMQKLHTSARLEMEG